MVRNELTVIIKSVIGERNHRWYIVAAIRPAGTNAKRNTQASVMRNVSYVSFPGTRVLFLDLIKNPLAPPPFKKRNRTESSIEGLKKGFEGDGKIGEEGKGGRWCRKVFPAAGIPFRARSSALDCIFLHEHAK